MRGITYILCIRKVTFGSPTVTNLMIIQSKKLRGCHPDFQLIVELS